MKKKKLYIILGSITGLVIVVIIGIIIFTYNSKLSYSGIESKMTMAAEKYYMQNKDLLPTVEGEEITVDANTLSTDKYMKKLADMLKKEVTCQGKVTVKKTRDGYFYMPVLNCGDKYNTVTLNEVISNKRDLTDEGSGLYDVNGEKVFRGENPDNYVSFANGLWRIVKIDKVGDLELISYNNNISKSTAVWDNRYNVEKKATVGINDYEKSRIREKLINYYNNDKLFPKKDRIKVVSKNFCIGNRSITDTSKDGVVECSRVTVSETIGLLPVYDVLNASLDVNCKSTKDSSCQNYNYLVSQGSNVSNFNYWLGTSVTGDTFNVYTFNAGIVTERRAASSSSLRPVIYLQNNVLFSKGTGTELDPYVIK